MLLILSDTKRRRLFYEILNLKDETANHGFIDFLVDKRCFSIERVGTVINSNQGDNWCEDVFVDYRVSPRVEAGGKDIEGCIKKREKWTPLVPGHKREEEWTPLVYMLER